MSYKDTPHVKLHVISTAEQEPDKDDRSRGCGWYPGKDSEMTREAIVTHFDRHKQFFFDPKGLNYITPRPGDTLVAEVKFDNGGSCSSMQPLGPEDSLGEAIDLAVLVIMTTLAQDGLL